MAREYLINLRLANRQSQQDVADSLGISRQYYALIEAGERQKNMDLVLATNLAKHFDIPLSRIIELEQSQNTA